MSSALAQELCTLSVRRGDSSEGSFQEFTVEPLAGELVFDAVLRIQATVVSDLAVKVGTHVR